MELYSYPSLYADSGLKAYYRAQDVNDSKNSFHLTNNGSTPFAAAKFGNGFNFGTANATKYMQILDDLGIGQGAITMSFWIKLPVEISSGDYDILYHGDFASQVNYLIRYSYVVGTPKIRFFRDRQGDVTQGVSYDIALGTEWHFVVMTYDTSDIRGYVDGVLVAGPTAATGVGLAGAIDNFTIGAQRNATNFTSGIIDDVAVFNRALTATEIANLYRGGSPVAII